MRGAWQKQIGNVLILEVRVQPRARRDEVAGIHADRLKIRVTAPPIDGAANAQLTRFLAREFGVARSRVEILSGQTGREKRIAIHEPARQPEWFDT